MLRGRWLLMGQQLRSPLPPAVQAGRVQTFALSVTAACSHRRALAEVPGAGGSGRGWQGAAVSSPTPSSRLTGSDPGCCTPAGKAAPC